MLDNVASALTVAILLLLIGLDVGAWLERQALFEKRGDAAAALGS